MNWYKLMLGEDRVCVLQTQIVAMSKPKPLVKLAYNSKEHVTDIAAQNDSDGATCKVQLTESKAKITLGVTYLTDVYSFPLFEEQWLYTKAENK